MSCLSWWQREGQNSRMTKKLTESVFEETVLEWLDALGYPPDKQEKATQTVIEQAELLSENWATA